MGIEIRKAINDAIAEEMRQDANIFVIGEEVGEYQGAYKVTKGLLEEFGSKRIIDTPITEHAFTGLAIGAAFMGLRPIVEFMTFNFAMQAIDQIINSAAKTHYMSGGIVKVPIVFRGPNGNAVGVAAQHSQCYAAWYAHIPGLKVIAPYFATDFKSLLKSAIKDDNPVIFLENELLYGNKNELPNYNVTNETTEIGKLRVVRKGTDVTIVAFSYAMVMALGAVEVLEKNGINVELIDLRTLRPLDIPAIIQSFKKTNRMVIVEAGWPFCNISSEIVAQIAEHAFDYMDAPICRVLAQDNPMPYSRELELATLPTYHNVLDAINRVCNFKFSK
ncbi:Pyruvate dehydrogenase E1 component subunit beta [Candidatus Xenohaliotis californiensis]|uniref:Pyruvate dehydrogenase E1 component subunit beta n=1 Tax=Candidatus Xenohaliotis californiensis TaxID=84677 RepID=A0ABM9N9E9_9RICK|nr:Pyruvate dehydrogenase E1 component subunit beta [Candidatus Xenohaliotis californiensis]